MNARIQWMRANKCNSIARVISLRAISRCSQLHVRRLRDISRVRVFLQHLRVRACNSCDQFDVVPTTLRQCARASSCRAHSQRARCRANCELHASFDASLSSSSSRRCRRSQRRVWRCARRSSRRLTARRRCRLRALQRRFACSCSCRFTVHFVRVAQLSFTARVCELHTMRHNDVLHSLCTLRATCDMRVMTRVTNYVRHSQYSNFNVRVHHTIDVMRVSCANT